MFKPRVNFLNVDFKCGTTPVREAFYQASVNENAKPDVVARAELPRRDGTCISTESNINREKRAIKRVRICLDPDLLSRAVKQLSRWKPGN